MPNLWRIEGGQVHLALHDGQSRAWRSQKRHVFVIAGTQSGKTSFGPWWLWNEIQRCGRGDYLAVTASFDLFKLKMLPELRTVFERVLGIGRWWAGERVLELADPATREFGAERADDADQMWGRIILRSAQSDGGLESATAKAAWLDECGQDGFTLEDWQAVQRRLSIHEGRVLGTTTPYNLGWLKAEIYDAWRRGDPDIDVVTFPSIANPSFPLAEFRRMEAKLQDWRFDMFYRGLFSRPAGLIYSAWRDEWLVDDFEPPADWQRAVGVDFGGANNCILWFAEHPETGVWYLYDEWLGGGKTSSEYAEKALSRLPEGVEALAWGGAKSEGQQRRDWAEGGFTIDEPPVADVEAGIDRGRELMKSGLLRVMRRCKGFQDEIGGYRRKLDDGGDPTDEILNKRLYHRMDAYRYFATGAMQTPVQDIIF